MIMVLKDLPTKCQLVLKKKKFWASFIGATIPVQGNIHFYCVMGQITDKNEYMGIVALITLIGPGHSGLNNHNSGTIPNLALN